MALAHFNLAERRMSFLAHAAQVLASPYTWVAFTTGVLVAINASLSGPGLSQSLGDTDDAVRLLTVRELMAGASLFDTTLPRIGAPDPLVSHWSRLIDVPLALLMMLLRPLTGPENAEWLVRATWPLMLFVALGLAVANEARRQAGSWATGIALCLIAIMPIAMVQFRPGRIDHHNAQILCAVTGILLLRRALEEPRAGWLAGMVLGLGLAVGYEGIALVMPMLALACVFYLLVPGTGAGPVNAAIATVATMLAVLVTTTAPARLSAISCDALSLNIVALAGCGAAALWVVSVLRLPLVARLSIAGVGAGVGALLYATLEPACLAGPFGQVDPALGSVWLDHVLETQTLFKFTTETPDAGVPAMVLMLGGIIAQILLFRRAPGVVVGFATAATVTAVVLGCWQIKLVPYALWLCVMPIAVLAAQLRADPKTMPLALRGLMALLLAITFSDSLVGALLPAKADHASPPVSHLEDKCYRTGNVQKLAALEPGLVAASTDLGPYIAALTPHRVVAAPYHRIGRSILAVHQIFTSEADAAHAVVTSLGVRYIAACTATMGAPNAGKGLRDRLLASETPQWLQEVKPGVEGMRVWRVLN